MRILSATALAAAALLLPACIEADVQTEVKEDGSGTFGMSVKCTEKFVEVMRKMEKLDPKQAGSMASGFDMFEGPDDARRAELEKAGLKVLECAGVNSEKELSMRVKLEFKDLTAFQLAEKLEKKSGKKSGGGPGENMWLSRDEKGNYTLEFSLDPPTPSDGSHGEDEQPEPAPDAPGAEAGGGDEAKPAEDPEEAAKKMQEAMAMMGELMGEATKLKFVVGLKVPGEIVEYAPKAGAKAEGGKVTWTLDFGTMMQMQMEKGFNETGDAAGEEDDGPDMNYKIVFRMPEGKSIPESALRAPKAAAPKAAPASTPPTGPVVPPAPVPPEPEGDR